MSSGKLSQVLKGGESLERKQVNGPALRSLASMRIDQNLSSQKGRFWGSHPRPDINTIYEIGSMSCTPPPNLKHELSKSDNSRFSRRLGAGVQQRP
jgi:hypothetical protein